MTLELQANEHQQPYWTIRLADLNDADTLAALFRLVYGNSTHPCQSAGNIRNGIASRQELWFLAEADSQVIGCISVITHSWNRSSEIGCGIVHPAFRNCGLGSRLIQACIGKLGCGSTLGFYLARSRTPHLLANRIAGFHSVFIGHDGGRHISSGTREVHMLAIAESASTNFRHIAPDHGAASRSCLVQENVYGPLGLRPIRGYYPDICFAGSPGEEGNAMFEYSFDSVADALELRSYCGPWEMEADIADHLEDFTLRHRDVSYISAQVLADKAELIQRMVEMGFKITAYLPAWCWYQKARYDCLMLVKSQFAEQPAMNGLESSFENLDRAWTMLAGRFLDSSASAAGRLAA